MKNDARLDLRLPAELKERIEMAAEGGSVNAWVRDACERKMDPYRVERAPHVMPSPKPSPKRTRVVKAKDLEVPGAVQEIPLPKIAPRSWGQ